MSSPMIEAQLVDYTDVQLKDYIGYLYEMIKRIDEEKKDDEVLLALKQKVKDYAEEHYDNEIRSLRAFLKAARNQAKVRELIFDLPEDQKDEW